MEYARSRRSGPLTKDRPVDRNEVTSGRDNRSTTASRLHFVNASSWKRPSQPQSLTRLTPFSNGYLSRHSFIDDEHAFEELGATC